MKPISEYSKEQYEFVRSSRKVLFHYCKTIKTNDFINQETSFGHGISMRNLLVHIAHTYLYWIADISIKRKVSYLKYDAFKDVGSVIQLFHSVDNCMSAFFKIVDDPESKIEYTINGMKEVAAPFKLFSHVITHEYHHKGQVLSISRNLGYVPVDTDIMR